MDMIASGDPRMLTRIFLMLGRRNARIISVTAGEADPEGFRRAQIAVDIPDDEPVELLVKRLERMIGVLAVRVPGAESSYLCHAICMKVSAGAAARGEITGIARSFTAEVVDSSPGAVTLFHAAPPRRTAELIGLLEPLGQCEVLDSRMVWTAL
jgi:acetolactate synthase small subunit